MDCVNHPGVQATAYCQNCGKALCQVCVRQGTGGQVFCEPCRMAWQSAQAPFPPLQPGMPNPGLAAVLGFIPGVGAMYNGQFAKGFIHLAIFAVLVSLADHFSVCGLFVAGWVFYQVFDAYHTAKARRDGLPLPDPLGLNEFAGWFQSNVRAEYDRSHGAPHPFATPFAGPFAGPGQPPPPAAAAPQAPAGGTAPPYAGAYQAPQANPYQPGYQPPPYQGAYQNPYQPPYWVPGASPWSAPPVPPTAGVTPPMPPAPPVYWRRREPVAAIVLIALGILFLLGQFDVFSGRVFEFSWPVLLIAVGAWLLIRRMHDSRVAAPFNPGPVSSGPVSSGNVPAATAAAVEPPPDADNRSQGGLE